MAQQSAVSLSVVVPFFDSADRLPICLDSLLAQTHPELQVVLVDDGSDDGSREIARRYVHEHPGVCLVEQG
ncbi:MAG: glycosyltransferase family 2 protein, partial [Acidothermales bacterium]|nr:glycosyltransferase family 2 protein [Acidothermales bacterium]